MEAMSFLRRSLFFSFFFYAVFCVALSWGSVWLGIRYLGMDPWSAISVGLCLFLILVLCVYGVVIHRPLRKIIHEMKALLTGRSYRRIMTSKQNEIGVLAYFFNEVTRNLESISGDVQTHARLRKEVDSAGEIQRFLIPHEAPSIPGLDISAKTRPASEIGGDTFDFYDKNGRHFMYIGDSTGHGIPAGIVMVMMDALLETFIDIKDTLPDILNNVNKYLKPHLRPTMFMTMILLEWLPDISSFKWVAGGHEYLIHLQTRQNKVQAFPAGGIAVGMLKDSTPLVKEQTLRMEDGDFLILYSDGIVEAKNPGGDLYGLERLQSFIASQASVDLSAEALFEKIALDVGRFMGGAAQLDDMTLIVLKHVAGRSAIVSHGTTW